MKTPMIYVALCCFCSCKISDLKLARLCSERFPNSTTTTIDSTRQDSVKNGSIESLPPIIHVVECPQSDKPISINVSLPGGVKQTDTVFQTQYRTKSVHDSALIYIYQDSFKTEKESREKYQTKADKQSKTIGRLWLWLIGLSAIVVILLRKPSLKILSFFKGVLRGNFIPKL